MLALEGHRLQGSLSDIYPSMELLWQHILTAQTRSIGQSRQLDLSFQLARE